MTWLFIAIVVSILWVNLIGLALAARLVLKDYAVARVASILVVCMALFCLEHFIGLGGRPPLLPFTTALSGWLIWRHWRALRDNWQVEAFFALGFAYCLAWRCAFPDIDLNAERIPDLVFVQDYMTGNTLPATDRWLPPYKISFYYGLQHYSAALMGRWLGLSSTLTYQFAYCTLVGLVTCAVGSAARVLCAWKPGPWLVTLTLLIGGNGVIVGLQAMLEKSPSIFLSSRFLGFHVGDHEWSALGRWLGWTFNPGANENGIELPMDAFSYLIFISEYHPPLIGFFLLGMGLLLIFTLEHGVTGRPRIAITALLAATIPAALLGNTWVAPLQILLVASWCVYRAAQRQTDHWIPCIIGGAVGMALAYPHLVEFTTQPIAAHSAIRWTLPTERAMPGQWLLMFWPVVTLLALCVWSRRRPAFALYIVCAWVGLLAFTELFFNDDQLGGTWNRYNSTLKWWPWVYAGALVTIGAYNLGSTNRICRWGSATVLVVTWSFALILGRYYFITPKTSAMRLDGTYWLTQHAVNRDFVFSLAARPDGIALESGPVRENSETGVLSAFANKASFLGWVVHEETIWRGGSAEIGNRIEGINAFYQDTLPNPLDWLLRNNIRYVLWRQRDNIDGNRQFRNLREKLKSHYEWHRLFGNDDDWALGFWERQSTER